MIQIKTNNKSGDVTFSNFEEEFINFVNFLIEKQLIKSINYIDIYANTNISSNQLPELRKELIELAMQTTNNKIGGIEFPVDIGNKNYKEIVTLQMYIEGLFDFYYIVQSGLLTKTDIVIYGN